MLLLIMMIEPCLYHKLIYWYIYIYSMRIMFYLFTSVRHLPDEKYLCSLCDEGTSRIVAVTCTPSYPHGDGVTIVTAGMELRVWKQTTKTETPTADR